MSPTIKFDTLAYANKLKNAGMDTKLAEALAEAQAEVVTIILDDQELMKQDIMAVKQDVMLVKNEVKDLRRDMSSMENRLMTKLGSIMVGGFGILATLLTILNLYH